VIGPAGAALVAAVFAAAGYAGAAGAEALCARAVPYDGGPRPVRAGRIPFAAAAACVGLCFALRGEPFAQLAIPLPAIVALAGCAAADLRCGLLPDALTLLPLAALVALAAGAHDAAPALGAAFVAAPFAACALLTRGRGMGWGDVKLAALGGALLGAGGATLAFILAALAASAAARIGGDWRRPVAFGPYLAASIAATLSFTRTF
jgi:leader peptidase (prepilin peptidase)/N-methyltransferase